MYRVADLAAASATDHWSEHDELRPHDALPTGPWFEVDHAGLVTLANAVSVILDARVRVETPEVSPCPAVLELVHEVVRESALFAREAYNQRAARAPKAQRRAFALGEPEMLPAAARRRPLRLDEARMLAASYWRELRLRFVLHGMGACPCCVEAPAELCIGALGLLTQERGTPRAARRVPKERLVVPHLALSRHVCRERLPFRALVFKRPDVYFAAAALSAVGCQAADA